MWESDVMITLAYYFALFFAPIVAYILFFTDNIDKNAKYRMTDWYYIIKRLASSSAVNNLKKRIRKSQSQLDPETQEQPKNLSLENQSDTQIIQGIDGEGNAIYLKLTLLHSRLAEITLRLILKDGGTYTFPNEPEVLLCSTQFKQWRAQGLCISVAEPFHRIRIVFNGLLKNTKSADVEHVKFNFIWNTSDKPLFHPQDVPNSILCDALSREPWRDGSWLSLMGDERGYDQYGALQGVISGETFQEDIPLHLPCSRKRYWGTAENIALHRDFSLFVVGEDGTLFTIGARSYRKGCGQMKYGTLLRNTGHITPVQSTDINLEYIGEDTIPNAFTCHVEASGKTFKCLVHTRPEAISTVSSATRGWVLKTVLCECVLDNQTASAIATFWYAKSGPGVDLPEPLLSEPKIENSKSFLAPFSSKECCVTDLSGGKGSSLALLTSLNSKNFVVPEGFVILSNAFQFQLEHNNFLKGAIAELNDVSRGREDRDLSTACKETVDLFGSEPVHQELAKMILAKIHEIGKSGDIRWAVRSSGLSEDSEELSAAGQNETFLGCKTDEDILKAVAACWGSLFSFQSVQYRRQLGLDIHCSMGVVVQKMVPAETAGVLFTCHPTTSDPSQMVITANYGLGESVVSGQADPDTVVVKKTWDDQISILSKEIGSKKVSINMTESGVQEKASNDAKSLCLTDDQALLLGKVGLELEKAYGNPRDIEWAFYKGQLYLLQSRPITTLSTWTDFELLHEFDMPIVTNQEILTVANVAEVMPKALTPLSNTIVNRSLSNVSYKFINNLNEEPFVMKFTSTLRHRSVINFTNNFLTQLEDKITISTKLTDVAVFGHPVTDERIHSIGINRFGVSSLLTRLRLMYNCVFWNDHYVSKALKVIKNCNINVDDKETALEKFNEICKAFPEFDKITECHGRVTNTSVIYQMIAINILAAGADDLQSEHFCDIALILSSCSNVVSAEVPRALETISSAIQETGLAEEFIKIKPEEGVKWLRLNCPKASKELDDFFEKHGHRGLGEFEFKDDSWAMNPGIIVGMLQINCKGDGSSRTVEVLTADETVSRLVTPKSGRVRKTIRFFVNKCRQAVAKRELTKCETVRFVDRMRRAFRNLGMQMVREGIIPDPYLLYHFSLYELKHLLHQKDPTLVRKAVQRQRLHPKWAQLKLPELIFGFPKFEENLKPVVSGVATKGTPACPGEVTARACVITDLTEIDQLKPGDVLITYATDIGWSPYFPILSAVVTELGGLISHGAVVAREYGLPCIVGVQNATSVFKTGNVVHISGKTGLISLVDEKDKEE